MKTTQNPTAEAAAALHVLRLSDAVDQLLDDKENEPNTRLLMADPRLLQALELTTTLCFSFGINPLPRWRQIFDQLAFEEEYGTVEVPDLNQRPFAQSIIVRGMITRVETVLVILNRGKPGYILVTKKPKEVKAETTGVIAGGAK
jgi:hypothetical protein